MSDGASSWEGGLRNFVGSDLVFSTPAVGSELARHVFACPAWAAWMLVLRARSGGVACVSLQWLKPVEHHQENKTKTASCLRVCLCNQVCASSQCEIVVSMEPMPR